MLPGGLQIVLLVIGYLFQRVHVILRSPCCHNLVLLEEGLRQTQRRRSFELVFLHSFGKDVLNFPLCHRIHLGLEVFRETERLNLQAFTLTD